MLKYIRLVMAAIMLLCLCAPAAVLCEPAGDLQVTLLPANAISAGAMWRVVGETTWHASGESVTYGIDSTWPGPTIEFAALVGWRSPQTRTIALVEDNTVSTTATYYPLSPIADSQADFSLTQGYNGWRYGYFSSGTTFTQFTQTQLNPTFGNLWYGGNGYLWNAGGQPYNETHKTVRRWVSTFSGHAVVYGHMWKYTGSNGGNGFTGSVSIGGVEKGSLTIGGSDNAGVNYSFEAQVTTGQNVDFMIDAILNTYLDNCGLTGIIATTTWTGSLKVNLGPAEAIASGAQWRRVGTSTWFSSGETEYDIPTGSYNVEFSTMAGWTAPDTQSVTIADGQLCQASATYPNGSMQVTIQPASAVNAGAQWRRVGTATWLASGTTESNVPVGSYTVEFTPLAGWRSPQTRTLAVASGAAVSTIATYKPSTVVIADSEADFSLTQGYKGWYYGWRPNGTTGFTQFTTSGTDSNGQYWTGGGGSWSLLWASYGHPEVSNETVRRWISSVSGPALIWGHIWKRPGQYYGNGFVGSVLVGGSQNYTATIAYNDNIGIEYSFGTTLASGTAVDLVINGNGNITSDHAGFVGVIKVPVSTGSLRVTIQPSEAVAAGAQWRRVGTSTWFASGETDYDVSVGSCSIEFSAPTGWTAPATQAVTIADGQLCQATGTYPTGSLFVTIEPALAVAHGAKWRRVGTTNWLNSGDSALTPVGSCSIEFKKIPNWGKPLTVAASITGGNATEITRAYYGGSIITWGNNTYGQLDVPLPNADFVSIAVGDYFCIGLKTDGSLAAWGYNAYLQCNVPSPNSGFVAVAAGTQHALGLKSDGSVVAWGLNQVGQCTVPAPNSGFVAVSVGLYHSIGLKADGSVVCWGNNSYGQCTPPSPNSGFVSVAAGDNCSLGLMADGSIRAWGDNTYGQLDVYSNSGFTSIATGTVSALGVKSDGSIACWGASDWGQGQVPAPNSDFVAAAGGERHSVGLKSDGSVVCWGDNTYGQCNVPSPNTGFISVGSGAYYGAAIKSLDRGDLHVTIQPAGAIASGAKWRRAGTSTWHESGETEYNIPVGDYSVEFFDIPSMLAPAPTDISITADQTCEVACTYAQIGTVKVSISPALAVTHKAQWRIVGTTTWINSGDSTRAAVGSNDIEFKKIGAWRAPATRTLTVVQGQTTQTSGTYHGGTAVAWGYNDHNQCSLPGPNSEFVSVCGGNTFSVGLKSDGSIVQWGSIGDWMSCSNSGFVAIASSNYHILALKSDGSVICWGDNEYGQCIVPAPNSGFVAIDGGIHHSIGLKSDGSIVTWGGNDIGQCTLPSPNSGFTAVAAGGYHSMAVKTDGSVLAWGQNYYLQCAIPSPNSGFASVAGGFEHSLGIKTDGSIVCWGYNGYHQCDTPSPNSGFTSVGSCYYTSVGLRADGSIAVWGNNFWEQGNVPTPNADFGAVESGGYHILAIRLADIGSLRVTIAPAEAAAAGGKWRRVGTSTWYASGETEYDVPTGAYTIELSDLAGWIEPSQAAVITNNQLTQITAAYGLPATMTLPHAKTCNDGDAVHIIGLAVSAAWPNVFYIETDKHLSGIRVEKQSHGLLYGKHADVVGILGTNANGERFIQASTAVKIETPDGSVKPLGMANKPIGGGNAPWQLGVLNGSGLNNIGLLVCTWGKVVEIEPVAPFVLPTWFKIDDGSGAPIKCIVQWGTMINSGWNYVSVTGISSCEKQGVDIVRVIRMRKQDDISSQ